MKPKGKVPSGSRDGKFPEKKNMKTEIETEINKYIYIYMGSR